MDTITPKGLWNFGIAKIRDPEFRKYITVGLLVLVLFEASFWAMNTLGIPWFVSYLVGFEGLTFLNFFLNDRWTFKGEKHFTMKKRFWIFQSQAVIYRVIQYTLFVVLSFLVSPYLALFLAVLGGFAYSYLMNTKYTWRAKSG